MGGYQFAHVDSWARAKGGGKKWSAAQIVAEVERDPGACPHIHSPLPPTLLYGSMPRQALVEAEAWAAEAQDTKGRRLRKDGCCLLAGVLSFPADRIAEWPALRDASVKWLKQIYGDRLKSVVEHLDEEHPHIHYFAVPRPGERFSSIHSGKAALDRAKQQGADKKAQNAAYRDGMRAWQDDYWAEVASRHGLARIGPGRRRLTRAQWKAEQAAQQLMTCEMSRLKREGELVDLAQGNLEQATQLAEAEAERHKKTRRELEEIIMEIKKQDRERAKQIQYSAQDSVVAARASAQRRKEWENQRETLIKPPAGLTYSQIERRRELAEKWDFLRYQEDIRRQAVNENPQAYQVLARIENAKWPAQEAVDRHQAEFYEIRHRLESLKPIQFLEKSRLSAKLREAREALAEARFEVKSLFDQEKKLLASCPQKIVENYRYKKEEEREKALADLLRKEAEEAAEERRREEAEAVARRERQAMRPSEPKKPSAWEPPRP